MESTTTETNFVSSNNNPADDHGDGSNVTGIIAATRNNGVGIAGVLSNFRVVVCKILNASNGGTTSSLIAATNYARRLGVSVMNLSLQNYPFSSTLANEFTACQNAGILLSICAGNQGRNNDTTPNYPSSCPHPNIIAIANHDDTDVRWAGSFKTLRTTARQAWFVRTRRGHSRARPRQFVQLLHRTSQAAPFVTALAAALKSLNPASQAPELQAFILGSVVTRRATAACAPAVEG
jgi:subtilisin family serine protease